VKGDQVLDPFLGTGTTMAAAMAAGRNSVGYEMDASLGPAISSMAETLEDRAPQVIQQRLVRHIAFILDRMETKGPLKHTNRPYGFPVMTAQEKELLLDTPLAVTQTLNHQYKVTYDSLPQKEFCRDWSKILESKEAGHLVSAMEKIATSKKGFKQGELF
ncbi:MAG: site-specific DNA-methyltransferase, partial [Desulfobacteraceae bacterium]|nr:site-specific DNA-methyltransferase [Desulfobacteraceae bacterium]